MKKTQHDLEMEYLASYSNIAYKPVTKTPVSGQTKLESAIEQLCNVGSGMIIAYAIMELVLVPVLHIGMTPGQNVWTTITLTIVSVIRGYCWRRIFNKKVYKVWANWLKNAFPNIFNGKS